MEFIKLVQVCAIQRTFRVRPMFQEEGCIKEKRVSTRMFLKTASQVTLTVCLTSLAQSFFVQSVLLGVSFFFSFFYTAVHAKTQCISER